MAETKWEARKSQYSEIIFYILLLSIYIMLAGFIYPRVLGTERNSMFLSIIIVTTLIPMLIIAWTILSTYMTKYTLTTERLLVTSGVLNRVTETVELYRVTDYRLDEPITLRVFGAARFNIYSSDNSTPEIALYVNKLTGQRGLDFMAMFRNEVESSRARSGVRAYEGVN